MQGRNGRRGGTRLALALVAVACALAAIVAAAAAEDATEATTFGQDGVAGYSLGTHFEETQVWSVAARGDGGLVAQRDNRIESFLADGAPDPASPPRQLREYRRVFPAHGGKSLVLDNARLTRVNGDGSVDTGFGGGTIQVAPWVSFATELPSGKVLVAGTGWGGTKTPEVWVEVQLVNRDGSIDRAVGKDGTLSLSLAPYHGEGGVREVSPAGDGGALVVGRRFLLKLRGDGSPDPGFGDGGLVDDPPPLAGARILPDGSIAAVGSGPGLDPNPSSNDLLTLRYTAAGAPASGFGDGGIRRFDLGGEEIAHVASWAADGSVVVGGSTLPPSGCFEVAGCEEVPLLAAFEPGGGLDPGFGTGGVLRLPALMGPSDEVRGKGVEALTRRPDGSIVAAGTAPPYATTAFLAAVSPQGALVPAFGEGGIVRMRTPVSASQEIVGFAPLADGKLIAGGVTDVGVEDAAVLIRHTADGSLDGSFGGGAGYVEVGKGRFVNGFAVGDSGQVLMSIYGYPRSSLLKLHASDGARDPSFGDAGAVALPKRVRVESVGFARDGGVIVVGTRDVSGTAEPGVVLRYRPDGTADRRFGPNGRVELQTPGGRVASTRALATGRDGAVFAGAVSRGRYAIVKLLPDGRPDPHFGHGGWALTNAGGTAKRVALRRSGPHIYLAGIARAGERHRATLLRFDANGRLDHDFGRRGRRAASIPKAAEPKAILPSRRGVLVVLNTGPKPLLRFGRGGKMRQQAVGLRPSTVENVRATVSGGRLILGWSEFSPETRRNVYYLAKRPLETR